MHNLISDREHAVLESVKRRRPKHHKWLLLAVPMAASTILYWLGGATHEPDYFRTGLDKVFRTSQGAWCSKAVSTACIYPSGEVHIPSGEARTSIEAYFALRPRIPGASALSGWAYDRDDRDTTVIQTREVRGVLNAADVLTGMIEGTPLTWKEVDPEDDKGALWLVLAPRLKGAKEHEHRSL